MARPSRKIQHPRRTAIAIIVDGQTEVWYFNMLKRNEAKLHVKIEPQIAHNKKISELFIKVKELSAKGVYEKIFWIIDFDTIVKETRESKKAKTPINLLKDYLNQIKKMDNVTVIINNPCLEYWFLLHFEQTSKYFPDCKGVVKQLKKYLKDYKKEQRYFTKEHNDIWLKLKSRLPSAIENAKKVKLIVDLQEDLPCGSQMHLFFESEEISGIN